MQFDLLRLSLIEKQQVDAFEPRTTEGRRPSREQWLRTIFSEKIAFQHFKNQFHYVPESDKKKSDPKIIIGRIGREVTTIENLPPEKALHETEHLAWRAAFVMIDPTEHQDGQKVAMQEHSAIGDPLALFQALVLQINERAEQPYLMMVSPITDASTFWEFVDAHEGEITTVEFELIAPNMFGQKTDLDEEMRALRDNEKAERAQVKLDSQKGLNLRTENIEQAVEYAVRGGGVVKARTKGGKATYNSKRKIKKQKVSIVDEEDKAPIDLIFDAIKLIFGG